MLDVLAILRKPVVTEKSTLLQEQNKYVFEVLLQATKPQVKEAVERAFEVKVLAVRMMRRKGELRRVGGTRRMVKTSVVKRAVVTLQRGDPIQIFEGA